MFFRVFMVKRIIGGQKFQNFRGVVQLSVKRSEIPKFPPPRNSEILDQQNFWGPEISKFLPL
jgi:hypothetical protein